MVVTKNKSALIMGQTIDNLANEITEDILKKFELNKAYTIYIEEMINMLEKRLKEETEEKDAKVMKRYKKLIPNLKGIVKELGSVEAKEGFIKQSLKIISHEDFNYLEDMLYYVLEKGNSKDDISVVSKFKEIVPHEKRTYIMSIADRLRAAGREEGMKMARQFKIEGIEEGIKRGKLEGKLEIAKKLLLKGIEEKVVLETTELTTEEIKNLKN